MVRVLITGITGLIGKRLMYRLVSDGRFTIFGQYFSKRNTDEYKALGVRVHQADLNHTESLHTLCDRMDVVVHCAAPTLEYSSKRYQRVHYNITRKLLEECLNQGVRHFVYVSSFGSSTDFNRNNSLPDEHTKPSTTGCPFDEAKIETETLVKTFCLLNGMIYTIIRPAVVIGAGSLWVTEPIRHAKSLLGLRLIKDGQYDACLINVDNLSEGIFLTLIHPEARNRTYFFMDDYGITWKQYLTDLLALQGLKISGSWPQSVAMSFSHLSAWLSSTFHRKSLYSMKLTYALSNDRRVNVSRAKNELGWKTRINYVDTMHSIAKSFE